MSIPNKIVITIPKPITSDYHSNSSDHPCVPIAMGSSCCGDCGDCYFNSVENYARMLQIHYTEYKNKPIAQLITEICKCNKDQCMSMKKAE